MATEAIVARRRAEAESAISDCVSVLATKYGVEAQIQPVAGVRDLELRRVMQIEAVAAALAQIAAAVVLQEQRELDAENESNGEFDNAPNNQSEDFPENFPARAKLVKLGKTYDEIKLMNRDELIALEGIGEKTADEILSSLPPKGE